MVSSADTPRARALGAELRQARERRGLSMRRLADAVGRSGSHISRWENGQLIPTEADTATVLAVLGVNGADRDRMIELARDAADPNWVAPGVDKQLAVLTEYERTAKTIINVEPLMVPGLLQTYDYARHIITAFGASSRGEANQRAHVRIGRQHVLSGNAPKNLVAFIGEVALRYPPCPNDVMVEQLWQLRQFSGFPNIDMRVLPIDRPAGPALSGAWALIEFARTKPVVQFEHYDTSATITDARAVSRYREAVDTLRDVAMDPAESVELIAEILATKERSC
ncbi:helix-turn-helix transcriptional regulator [Saccharopolyspora cebuensis]|uniref:Scr1 family TA system antitoxin-like transcriptional regulator n=1 Tax=Saccharopolyspora cebuensis TaxID=418759 RepID=A0ABV4CFB9_9PSEU